MVLLTRRKDRPVVIYCARTHERTHRWNESSVYTYDALGLHHTHSTPYYSLYIYLLIYLHWNSWACPLTDTSP